MSDFEKYLHKFANDVQAGRLDLAVLKDKFIKAGLYSEKPLMAPELAICPDCRGNGLGTNFNTPCQKCGGMGFCEER